MIQPTTAVEPSVTPPFASDQVADAFSRFNPAEHATLLAVRGLIHELATETPGVGTLEESLKWGSPSYVTVSPRTGTPIRLDRHNSDENTVGVYVHCQSRVMEQFKVVHPSSPRTLGARALLLHTDKALPLAALSDFLLIALTYRLRARR